MNDRLVFGPPIDGLLDRLYEQHVAQGVAVDPYFTARAAEGSLDWNRFDERTDEFLKDKLIALDRPRRSSAITCAERSELAASWKPARHSACRPSFLPPRCATTSATTGPRPVRGRDRHRVRAGESQVARAHFAEAGLADLIDLREGDLRETLVDVGGPIDFMLIDIWTPMARPALSLIAPHLREGAVVICDNTVQFREAYGENFDFVHDPRNGLRTMTLPFEGGLEFTVRAR